MKTINGRQRLVTISENPSKTEQSKASEANINTIMARAIKTGMVPIRTVSPLYGDFSECVTYHETLDKINEAYDDFMKIPSQIRNRFQNDPHKFMEFLQNPNNLEEAIALGLVKKVEKENQTVSGKKKVSQGESEGSES